MKKIISSILAITLCVYAFGQEVAVANHSTTVSSSTAAFSWSETTYDFGKTKVGIPVSYEFSFTNAGAVPLIISSVKASCGCTVTAYTKDPVPNGGSGFSL